jgi:hypothetical protein
MHLFTGTEKCKRKHTKCLEISKGKVKDKVKLSLWFNWAPCYNGILGSGGRAPRTLDLDTKWRWVVSFTPRPLYSQGKNPSYLLDMRLGGPYSCSGRGDEEKNFQPLPGLEPPIIQPAAQRCTAELSLSIRLQYFYLLAPRNSNVAARACLNTNHSYGYDNVWLFPISASLAKRQNVPR